MIDSNQFKELKKIIEDYQKVKIIDFKNYGESEFKFTTYPVSRGDKPSMEFIIQDGSFRLININLAIKGKGTGTAIFNWIKEYCIKNNLKKFEVKTVRLDNIAMNTLCRKFGMRAINKREENGQWFVDYELELT